MATSDARTDFKHAGKVGHRRRRTERVIPVEVLKPLIGNVVLDAQQAQTKDGDIEWSKVVVLDTTAVESNAMNHAGIARVGRNCGDKEILCEMKNSIVDTSECDNILRVSPHHNGAVQEHKQVSAMLKKEAELGYYDGPYRSVPFIGCRVLPLNVVIQIRPDGTVKYRICRDGGWDHDGDSPNDCIDMSQQPQLILVRMQDFALAGAVLRSAGLKVYFWVIDLVGAYRQLTKATKDIHKQVMLWFDPETGDPQFWVDLRCYFEDRIMVHKFSRVSNVVVYCATEKSLGKRRPHEPSRAGTEGVDRAQKEINARGRTVVSDVRSYVHRRPRQYFYRRGTCESRLRRRNGDNRKRYWHGSSKGARKGTTQRPEN